MAVDVGVADPKDSDDMAVDNGLDGGPVSTLGIGIEKKIMPVAVSCDDNALGVLVGRLGKSFCVASTELIEESAIDMTSNALEGVLVGVWVVAAGLLSEVEAVAMMVV